MYPLKNIILFISYCTQIGFYFVLKSKRISVQNHEVIRRLVQFRSLLHQLENAGQKLQPEIDDLLSKIHEEKEIKEEDFLITVQPPRKKLRILNEPKKSAEAVTDLKGNDVKPKAKKSKDDSNSLTRDEQDALEFYKAVSKKKSKESSSDEEDVEPSEEVPADVDGSEAVGKRAINYQIAKNKGLTPHRPKEQRNPRVKHRMKYRQAKIRRKGAVREPRKENNRYAGETSGIKATVIRSVKLK